MHKRLAISYVDEKPAEEAVLRSRRVKFY